MQHIQGISRNQLQVSSLEDTISAENPVRFIDAFVGSIDLEKLGFTPRILKSEGRPSFDTVVFLKIYLYGYINGIRSSRRLEKECLRNLEMQWLLEAICPNYHSIADFRRDNPKALKQLFKLFVSFLKDVDLMVRLTKAVIKGTNLPVTVKTRLGWDESSINIDEVAERLQDIGVQALTVHARTRAQMYKGHSDWSHIQRIKENPRITMPIFGNGDIDSPEKALEYKNKYGLDGMMIGRAAIGYPWIFNEIKHYFATGEKLAPPSMNDRIEAARNHLIWSIEWKGERLGINEMRRHYTNYFKGIHGFKEYKQKLVTTDGINQLLDVFTEIEQVYTDYVFEG